MKFDKQLAVILVLVSMLLSAVAISFYFYKEKEKTELENNQIMTIFVAKDTIKKDTLITKDHIKRTTIARKFVLTKPLVEREIVGKYTKETIYQNEAFLKEKLSNEIVKEKKKSIKFQYSSYNMGMKLFQNPNYAIQPNDIIKIVSVYPQDEKSNNFSVQYVAKNIRVLGFLSEGYETEKAIYKKKIKKLIKKEQVEEIVNIKADEIILDIKEKVLLRLIDDYNKGKQLWMVKSKIEAEPKSKKSLASVNKSGVIDKKYEPKKYVKKSYPLRWYKPKDSITTKTAIISYINDSENKIVKKSINKRRVLKRVFKNQYALTWYPQTISI